MNTAVHHPIVIPAYPLLQEYAGVFNYRDRDGIEHDRDFFVRCEPAPQLGDPDFRQVRDRRINAYNEQYQWAYFCLQNGGCTHIKLYPVEPDPFFL